MEILPKSGQGKQFNVVRNWMEGMLWLSLALKYTLHSPTTLWRNDILTGHQNVRARMGSSTCGNAALKQWAWINRSWQTSGRSVGQVNELQSAGGFTIFRDGGLLSLMVIPLNRDVWITIGMPLCGQGWQQGCTILRDRNRDTPLQKQWSHLIILEHTHLPSKLRPNHTHSIFNICQFDGAWVFLWILWNVFQIVKFSVFFRVFYSES
jgi:hypothetical protein